MVTESLVLWASSRKLVYVIRRKIRYPSSSTSGSHELNAHHLVRNLWVWTSAGIFVRFFRISVVAEGLRTWTMKQNPTIGWRRCRSAPEHNTQIYELFAARQTKHLRVRQLISFSSTIANDKYRLGPSPCRPPTTSPRFLLFFCRHRHSLPKLCGYWSLCCIRPSARASGLRPSQGQSRLHARSAIFLISSTTDEGTCPSNEIMSGTRGGDVVGWVVWWACTSMHEDVRSPSRFVEFLWNCITCAFNVRPFS